MTRLIWLDLETTGLDPADGLILELGMIETDQEARILWEQSWTMFHEREKVLLASGDKVLAMHISSGLHPLTWRGPAKPLEKAQEQALVRLWQEPRGEGDVRVLCGSSVHFDRSWLRAHMPDLERVFHYRTLDVSAFRRAAPELMDEYAEVRGDREPSHRALDDLRESIALYRFMREKLGLPVAAEVGA